MVISRFLRIRRMVDKGRTHGFQAIVVGTACLFAQTALAADTPANRSEDWDPGVGNRR